MLTLKHHVFHSPVTESSYDYWSIYQNDKLILVSKRHNYVLECFEKLMFTLKSKIQEIEK